MHLVPSKMDSSAHGVEGYHIKLSILSMCYRINAIIVYLLMGPDVEVAYCIHPLVGAGNAVL